MSTTTSSKSVRLSVVMIVKDEEKNLDECLNSISWVDEVIVLDSGSTDATREIAEKHGARFYCDDNWQGYGIQRQRAQAYATGEWVFVIDADERVIPELAKEIRQVVKENRQEYAV